MFPTRLKPVRIPLNTALPAALPSGSPPSSIRLVGAGSRESLSAFAGWLRESSSVERLIIDHTSTAEDLGFLNRTTIPSLVIRGSSIKSLCGIQHIHGLRDLSVNTGPENTSRDIGHIVQTSIDSLGIHYGNVNDIDAILSCQALKGVGISHLKTQIGELPPTVDRVSLTRPETRENVLTAAGGFGEHLSIIDTKRSVRFTGTSTRVKMATLRSCPKLRLETLSSFPNLESLGFMGWSQSIDLGEVSPLESLETLLVWVNQVTIPNDIKARFPRLKTLRILPSSRINDSNARTATVLHPGLTISDGEQAFHEGEPVPPPDLGRGYT